MMRLYKTLFWFFLVFLLCIWQAIDFVLALVNRSKSQKTCETANPSSSNETSGLGDKSISVGGYTTTFLGMQLGNTYGLANCAQAVQAGVIGLAILLFVGQLAMVSCLQWGLFCSRRTQCALCTPTSSILRQSLGHTQQNCARGTLVIAYGTMSGVITSTNWQWVIVTMPGTHQSIAWMISTKAQATNSWRSSNSASNCI